MAGIIGTIIDIKSYLEDKEYKITVHSQHEAEQEISLFADREYIIPSFQRELRWNVDNVNVLISDLSRGPIFLGNVILTIKDNHKCEIIDGQQRTTILILILSWLKQKYGTSIELPSTCKIDNLSFQSFQALVDCGFNKCAVSEQTWHTLISQEKDKYSQFQKVQTIWESFGHSEILNNRYSASSLVQNMKQSKINIIASYSDDITTGIRYFLDVNLKGIRLDTEDIFKAHLFEIDTRNETRELWEKIKHAALLLNTAKAGKDNRRYPLMKIYEHFFYCDLYKNPAYSQVKFGEDFFLSDTVNIESHYFYKGVHLIEVICDRDYLKSCLERILAAIEIMTDIIESTGPTDKFKSLFMSDKTIDSIEIENCHSLMQKILLEKEVIPKILALNYIIAYFDGKIHAKKEYKSFYSVFSATVLFSIFANKKESETFYSIVREEDWRSAIDKWLYDYISSHDMTRGKLLAAYKCDEDNEDDAIHMRCKSLAAIVNFFSISRSGDQYSLKVQDVNQLKVFLIDKEQFSLEHFIIGDSCKLEIKTSKVDFSYEYPAPTKKYRNSLFNYIFIPRTLNNNLRNELIHAKNQRLIHDRAEITCKYSQKYLECAFSESVFTNYPRQEQLEVIDDENAIKERLDEYFKKDFPEEFLFFATSLLHTITW